MSDSSATGDVPVGMLRRIRRLADLSQRELALRVGVSKSAVAAAEAGTRDLPVRVLAHAAALAGLRLALLDEQGAEVPGMDGDAVRDGAGRLFPAHLDPRYGDEGWWHDEHRYSRDRPWYTFDRDRGRRDAVRRTRGTSEDHQLPRAGDSPAQRAAARREKRRRAASDERRRRFLAGAFSGIDLRFDCSCPPACDELDDRSGRPVHVEECPCGCDLA
ncbi:helix-turn-helix domain-containing protein [Geodermatophilus ruber]|uniref:HTH-type transcriptional regulator / antitoxin HipB n=1 Tax=Geodermatophilus ruber TaxID=504800 RepID=A0A1I4DB91_9ACTN|nr:helix-turn-helix transcriptional regulator [Geodermatophilus ruber]SFK90263.1 HTH-type transcriptional regulator / antitoxin HipB [Geodermatophilus ruber]